MSLVRTVADEYAKDMMAGSARLYFAKIVAKETRDRYGPEDQS